MKQMATQSLFTASQLALLSEDNFFYELDEGELIRMPPPAEDHGWVQDEIHGVLFNYVKQHKLGKTYSETGFLLQSDPDVVRAPDLAFIRTRRMPPKVDPKSHYILGAPDLAVEVQSPSQSPADLQKKTQQYLAAGAGTVWVLYPQRRQVVIHRRGVESRTLSIGDSLEDPDLLPGLRIPVTDLFKPE